MVFPSGPSIRTPRGLGETTSRAGSAATELTIVNLTVPEPGPLAGAGKPGLGSTVVAAATETPASASASARGKRVRTARA
jgi:hypothetical protein